MVLTFKQRPKESERGSCIHTWGKSVLGRGNSKFRGPESRWYLARQGNKERGSLGVREGQDTPVGERTHTSRSGVIKRAWEQVKQSWLRFRKRKTWASGPERCGNG